MDEMMLEPADDRYGHMMTDTKHSWPEAKFSFHYSCTGWAFRYANMVTESLTFSRGLLLCPLFAHSGACLVSFCLAAEMLIGN